VWGRTYFKQSKHFTSTRAEWAKDVLQTHDRDIAGFKDREYAIPREEITWREGSTAYSEVELNRLQVSLDYPPTTS
jgi:hypothetical protein